MASNDAQRQWLNIRDFCSPIKTSASILQQNFINGSRDLMCPFPLPIWDAFNCVMIELVAGNGLWSGR